MPFKYLAIIALAPSASSMAVCGARSMPWHDRCRLLANDGAHTGAEGGSGNGTAFLVITLRFR
jgi:hypothetical protein